MHVFLRLGLFMLIMVLAGGAPGEERTMPRVTRGVVGPGSATVHLSNGVSATWDTRSGSLQQVTRRQANATVTLADELPAATWFVTSEAQGDAPTAYRWLGYELTKGGVTLRHEIVTPTGQIIEVHERPRVGPGPGGLLSLHREFSLLQGEDPARVVKRISTATPEGVTFPITTTGTLRPLGPDNNRLADVTFRASPAKTEIVLVFNAQWPSSPPVDRSE